MNRPTFFILRDYAGAKENLGKNSQTVTILNRQTLLIGADILAELHGDIAGDSAAGIVAALDRVLNSHDWSAAPFLSDALRTLRYGVASGALSRLDARKIIREALARVVEQLGGHEDYRHDVERFNEAATRPPWFRDWDGQRFVKVARWGRPATGKGASA
jgi:hypothetical protein